MEYPVTLTIKHETALKEFRLVAANTLESRADARRWYVTSKTDTHLTLVPKEYLKCETRFTI